MAGLVFIALQITVILAIASIAARWLMQRSSQISWRVSFVGILLAFAAITAAVLPVPRVSLSSLLPQNVSFPSQPSSEHASAPTYKLSSGEIDPSLVPTKASGGVNVLHLLAQLQRSTNDRANDTTHLMTICVLGWALLVGLGGIKIAIGMYAVWRLKRSSQAYRHTLLQNRLNDWAKRHKARGGFELRVSDQVASPCVIWLDRQAIYLPPTFAVWTQDEQLAVLAHEAAHLLRRDAQWRLLFDVLRNFVNAHPLSWVLNRQFVLAQEMSADQLAGQLLSADGYRKGLCKLALRMDAQPQPSRVALASQVSLGVSVSTNSLVRRIKMLSSPKSRQLSGWQQLLAIALVASSGLSVALCTVKADEPLRIASRATKSKAASQPFTRYTSQPWEELGVQNGYFRVLPSVAAERPMIKKPMDEFAVGVGLSDLDCGIELSRDWVCWTSNFDLNIRKHEGKGEDDAKYSLSMLGDKPLVEFAREVDWAEVAEKVNLRAFAIEDNQAALKKFLAEQGRSKTLRAVSNSSSDYGNYRVAKFLWPVIDGGVTAAVFPLADLAKVDPEHKQGELASEIVSVARKCSFAGVGVDFQHGDSPCQVRLAFVPKQEYSAKTIQEETTTALAAILEAMQETEGMTEAEKVAQARWVQELEAWKVSTKEVNEQLGEIVLIEGVISDASLVFPLM